MATQHAGVEAEIRQRLEKLAAAISAMDLESLMPIYAPDIASFDVGPSLRDVGVAAKRKNWEEAFTVLQPPLNYETRDLTITVGGDVAFAYGFGRLSGMLEGNRFGAWVRLTVCFRKIDGNWLIVHDHVSAPLDFASGRAVMNLEP